MDSFMDIQAVEAKLSDVTVTPISKSQVQNFYNYQQQREQREQQPQIQISAIINTPRDRGNNDRDYGHHSNTQYSKRERDFLSQKEVLQAQLALLQQHTNVASLASSARPMSNSTNGNNNTINNSNISQLKYPQSTSPLVITTQTSANITTPMTSTANLPTVSNSGTGNGLTKYAQLLAIIEEMGRDIRPTYTGSRSSTERLKRGIVHARILVRECLMETERSARQ